MPQYQTGDIVLIASVISPAQGCRIGTLAQRSVPEQQLIRHLISEFILRFSMDPQVLLVVMPPLGGLRRAEWK